METKEDAYGHLETHYKIKFKNGASSNDLQFDHKNGKWEKYGGLFGDNSFSSDKEAIKSIIQTAIIFGCKKCR